MGVFRIFPAVLAIFPAAFFGSFPLIAPAQDPGFSHARTVPEPVQPAPFPTNAARKVPVYSVELRTADELTERDRLLLADTESSIAERTHYTGVDYDGKNWSYRQIVCPAFPNHLFLQFMRNNGVGDVTVFSASIPRNGDGRLRIIPVLKRGYSLFSPAPINALTIAAFNHIRAEEGDSANSDWLNNALCYAALAGTQPQIQTADAAPAPHHPIAALTAAMDVEMQTHGTEVVRFDDAGARPHPMEWTMTFTHKGKLIKATHRQAGMVTAQAVPQKSAVIGTRPAP